MECSAFFWCSATRSLSVRRTSAAESEASAAAEDVSEALVDEALCPRRAGAETAGRRRRWLASLAAETRKDLLANISCRTTRPLLVSPEVHHPPSRASPVTVLANKSVHNGRIAISCRRVNPEQSNPSLIVSGTPFVSPARPPIQTINLGKPSAPSSASSCPSFLGPSPTLV